MQICEGENRIQNYADIWNLFENRARIQLHTSGHATWKTLAEVCNQVNPSTAIIPIHKDASSHFGDLPITEELRTKIVVASEVKGSIEIKVQGFS